MRTLMLASLALAACEPGSDPVALAPQVQVEPKKPRSFDPWGFLRKAVVEGLTEDGVDRVFVKESIAGRRDLFVEKCLICESVRTGFQDYASTAPAEKPASGPGIPKDIVDELRFAARVARLNALERLVDRYVSRHYDRLQMTAEERRLMQTALEDGRKEGMILKELGPNKGFGDFCPSCNGAAKAK
jgi:hypothetical protein